MWYMAIALITCFSKLSVSQNLMDYMSIIGACDLHMFLFTYLFIFMLYIHNL